MLASGTLNLKRFEQRAGETLVLGELLDRTVRITESGRPAHVVDAGMEQTRTGDWVLAKLAVQEPGRLGRRGQLHQLDWDEVEGLALPQSGQGTETLLATYRELNAADLAHALQELPAKRRHEVAEALDDERLADVLGELPEADQVDHPRHARRAAGRRRARGDGPRRRRRRARRVLQRRPQPAARAHGARRGRAGAPAAQVLRGHRRRHDDQRAGDPLPRRDDRRGAGAGARARADAVAGQPGVRLPAAVGDARPAATWAWRTSSGCCANRRRSLVSGILDDLEPLRPEAPLAEVTRYFATYNLVAAPVVDDQGRLVGAVSVDDVLDHLLPDDWRERARRG